jgi:transcriptional regulator with PAS, ATPase and Fis domain
MFQDVYDTQNRGRENFRHIIASTPIFDETGIVKNVVAVIRRIDAINDDYKQASSNRVVSRLYAGRPDDDFVVGASIVSESGAMRKTMQVAANIASTDSNVLLTGETGTGKEIIARFIHEQSARRDKPFVVINCAALPETLLEAELFGYEKGAFTGASVSGRTGLFESAQGGTLFLDEINSFPIGLQGRLLRAIEGKTIRPIGNTREHEVNFRLLAASNVDLESLLNANKFRPDLYYRLNVINIVIPPLRERREDIIPLALHFLKDYCNKYNKNKTFSPQTFDAMEAYEWPGNVREVKNFVERSVVMSLNETIAVDDIGILTATTSDGMSNADEPGLLAMYPNAAFFEDMLMRSVPLDTYVSDCEKQYFEYALNKHQSSYSTAQALGTSQTSVMRRKKKYGL